jgi:hypothetical protein
MGEPRSLNLPPDSVMVQETVTIAPEDNYCNMVKGDMVIEEEMITGKMVAEPVDIEPDSIIVDSIIVAEPDSIETVSRENYLGGLVVIEDTNEEGVSLVTELIETSEAFVQPKNDLTVFPNPGKGEFTFKYELQKASM